MTCREKLKIEHPEHVSETWGGGCFCCPNKYGYLDKPDYCANPDRDDDDCERCWDREIPEDGEEMKDENPHILDSGARREFESGAVRDIQEGKGRCDLLPLDICADYIEEFEDNERAARVFRNIRRFQESSTVEYLYFALNYANPFEDNYTMILEIARQFEEGAKKYGERNWEKGIPVHCYVDSAIRHYMKYLRGDKDEPHDRALCWNLMCAIWTCEHHPELNEYAQRDTSAVEEMMD